MNLPTNSPTNLPRSTQRTSAYMVDGVSAQDWLNLIAIATNDSIIARVINEALRDEAFNDLVIAIGVGLPAHRTLGFAAARQLSECLFKFSDSQSQPASDVGHALQKEHNALKICDAWLSAIPHGAHATDEENGFYRTVLATCLAHATGNNQEFSMDYFLSHGAKILELPRLKEGGTPQLGDSGNCALASAVLSYNETEKSLDFLGEIEKKTGPISFDVVDESIAKQYTARGRTPEYLVDSGRLLHRLCLDRHDGKIDRFEKVDWMRERIPARYMLPYHVLWNKAVEHVQALREHCNTNVDQMNDDTLSRAALLKSSSDKAFKANKMLQCAARFLAAGAQPLGDEESRSSAWRHLLHEPLDFAPYGSGEQRFPDLLHALVCSEFVVLVRQRTLKAIADCGGMDVNALHHGTTLLHSLVKMAPTDSIETAYFLLHAGARTDIENTEGVTALQLARETGSHALATAFATFEAKRAIDAVLMKNKAVQPANSA